MYILRKMNQEKQVLTESEAAALVAKGYRNVTPVLPEPTEDPDPEVTLEPAEDPDPEVTLESTQAAEPEAVKKTATRKKKEA